MRPPLKFLLSFGAIFVALAILEIYLRASGWALPPATYEGKTYYRVPGGKVECMNPAVSRPYFSQAKNPYPGCVFYSISKRGFRNSAEPEPWSAKALAIGDSLTYGFGVLEEDTFLKKLESHFARSQFLNAAAPAAGLPQYEKSLKENLNLRPKLVIIGIHLNDVMDFPTSLLVERVTKKCPEWLRKMSRLADFSCHSVEAGLSRKENLRAMRESFTEARIENFRNFARSSRNLTEKSGAKIIFLIYPVIYDFRHYGFSDVHAALAGVLKEEGVETVDFLPYFTGKRAEDFWITANDQHPNEKANEIFFAVLKERPLLRSLFGP
jgi:lysophospholipase L1-like esterase